MEYEKQQFFSKLCNSLIGVGSIINIETKANCWVYTVSYTDGSVDEKFRGALKLEFPHIRISSRNGLDDITLDAHRESECLIRNQVDMQSEIFDKKWANDWLDKGTKGLLIVILLCIVYNALRFVKPEKYAINIW